MPSPFDPYMPGVRLQFTDGGALSIRTVSCADEIHQAVRLAYTPNGSNVPTMEVELPPKSVEVIIQQLQEHANHARFINGERMLEYPRPYPAAPGQAKARRREKPTGQQCAPPNGGAAGPPGDSGSEERPPSAS